MHTSQQQPDFNLLPTPAGIPLAHGAQMRETSFSQSHSSQDAAMDDASYPSSHEESPMADIRNLNLNVLKMRSKVTKDGLPAKKRGPKRDSKPAMSRRQELNRQAQRTHRERKEIYTKSLEMEVSRLKESFVRMVAEKADLQKRAHAAERRLEDDNFEALRHENDRLKQLLQVNGVNYDRIVQVAPPVKVAQQPYEARLSPHSHCNHNHNQHFHQFDFNTSPVEPGYHPNIPQMPQASQRTLSNGNSVSPSQASTQNGFTHVHYPHSVSSSSYGESPPHTMSSRHSPGYPETLTRQTSNADGTIGAMISNGSSSFPTPPVQEHATVPQTVNTGMIQMANMDHDQVGIDFILAMEENCRDHQQYLAKRANPPTGDMNVELSGHAMMITNPLPSHMKADPDKPHHQPPIIPSKYLSLLAETSLGIPLKGGEVVPAQALRIIRSDERYNYMTRQQFDLVTERLRMRSRCYGFGAVVEAFEVRDAMNAAFSGELYQETIGEAKTI